MRLPLLLLAPAVLAAACASAPSASSPAAAPAAHRAFRITTTPYPQLQGPRGRFEGGGWWKDRFEKKCALAQKGGFDVMLVGDSITHAIDDGKDGGAFKAALAPATFAGFGYSGDRTENVLWRLDHGELEGKLDPKVVMVMIGTNNTGHRMDPPAEIAEGVGAVVGRLTARFPKAHILLLDIFPRGADASDAARRNNAAANLLLAKLDGSAGGHVHFFPIGSKFLDEKGGLPREVMPDLLHPNAKGYKIWADAVGPKIRELLAK